jgi:hypothetical protein
VLTAAVFSFFTESLVLFSDNIPYLESLFNQIEDCKQVNNWSTQGQIIVDFIELSKKVLLEYIL